MNKQMSCISKSTGTLLTNKPFFLGIAMLSVVLYHAPHASSFMRVFEAGFIGVDFFLFFSGYSLCYSIKKRSLGEFYRRRFWRIAPLFVLLAIVVSLLKTVSGKVHLNVFDWFCNLTTLSYYKIGGCFIDWYLCALFLFYLAFPLLYYFGSKANLLKISNIVWGGVIALLICGIVSVFDISWWYGCAIGRIPIFCLGVLCYFDQQESRNNYKWYSLVFLLVFALSVFLYLKGTNMRGFFISDMVAPTLMLLIALLVSRFPIMVNSKMGGAIEYIGTHSLEIYVANVISELTWRLYFGNSIMGLVVYLLLNTVLAYLLILFNDQLSKIKIISGENK